MEYFGHDINYLDLCHNVLEYGERQPNRTGVDSISLFGLQYKYDLLRGFPLLTTKKINFDLVKDELFWFLNSGYRMNLCNLPTEAKKLWKPWCEKFKGLIPGDCGRIYGAQWTHWVRNEYDPEYGPINQIQDVIDALKKNPMDRRLIVSAWNPADLDDMCLPPCHIMFHLKATSSGFLDLLMYQRSCDVPVGVPFNIASYALLLHMIAQEVNMCPRYFIHSMGDAHIYVDQIDGIKEQMRRTPKPAPKLEMDRSPFWKLTTHDVRLVGYDPHPFIKFPVAV